jgi:hypothetical protein
MARTARVKAGLNRTVKLSLRQTAPGGRYTALVRIVDSYGRQLTLRQTIRATSPPH